MNAQTTQEELVTEAIEVLQSESFPLSYYNMDLEFIEAMKNSLNLAGKIDAAYAGMVQNCNDDLILLNNVAFCKQTAKNIVEAQEEMAGPLLATVESLLTQYDNPCQAGELNEIKIESQSDIIRDTSEILLHQCLQERKRGDIAINVHFCKKEVICSIASTISISGLWKGGLGSDLEKRDCLSTENDCLTQFFTSLVSFLISSISKTWELIKIGGNWMVEKGKQFWGFVIGAEDETSANQELLQNLSDENVEDIQKDPKGWLSNMLNLITSMLGEWLRTDVFCEEWKGIAHFSECRQPLQAWSCLGCNDIISGICSFGGAAMSMIVEAFLTGGVLGALSTAAKGAKIGVTTVATVARAGVTTMKSSPHYAKLIKHLDNAPFSQRVVNMSRKIGRRGGSISGISIKQLTNIGRELANSLRIVGESIPVKTARNVLIRLGNTSAGRASKTTVEFGDRVFQEGFRLTNRQNNGEFLIYILSQGPWPTIARLVTGNNTNFEK